LGLRSHERRQQRHPYQPGILNRAFYLVATALGGYAWEKAGRIWYPTALDKQSKSNAQSAISRASPMRTRSGRMATRGGSEGSQAGLGKSCVKLTGK
jgi:Zn-dependent metalloprotease